MFSLFVFQRYNMNEQLTAIYTKILTQLDTALDYATIEGIPLDKLIRAYAQLESVKKDIDNHSPVTINIVYEEAPFIEDDSSDNDFDEYNYSFN